MVFPEHTTNLMRGQGFRSNNNVLQRFVANNQHQKALDYFRIKGTYAPNRRTPEYMLGNPEYFGAVDINGITYGDLAFTSYANLRATFLKELYHYNKVRAGIPFSTQEVPEGLPRSFRVAPEEVEGFIFQYKNRGLFNGLFHRSTIDSRSQISFYQNQIFDLKPSQVFAPRRWYFIYGIPRRW